MNPKKYFFTLVAIWILSMVIAMIFIGTFPSTGIVVVIMATGIFQVLKSFFYSPHEPEDPIKKKLTTQDDDDI